MLSPELSNEKKFDGWIFPLEEDPPGFPPITRKAVGYQLHKIQYGIEPDDGNRFQKLGLG